MPIFRYTFKKMLLTPSTWIILVMTVAFLALFNSLPLTSLGSNVISSSSAERVLSFYLLIWKMLVFQMFLGLMLFIFIAVKATQVFRDEIDDGTLLILVSKPISRTKIWTEKLLSLQTMILLFMFLSIFISSIFIAIPGIGSGAIYSKMFPYMWILFGVGIIFDLIVSSIAILLSLVMNAKAIIAIMIGFTALLQILSSSLIMNQIAAPTNEYMQASQAAAVYSTAKNKLNASDLTWLNSYIADTTINTINTITTDLNEIYAQYIPTVTYPTDYNYKLEQEFVIKIAKGEVPPTGGINLDLTKHILAVANVFRQWNQQSFSELLTHIHVGPPPTGGSSNAGQNKVDYSVKDMIDGLTETITQKEYETSSSQLLKTKVLRYLNIFYHLGYIWDGISTPDGGRFINSWKYTSNYDPYLFSWKKNANGEYQVDTSKKADSKIISFTADLTVYLVIGLILFASSWFVFNRKDFA